MNPTKVDNGGKLPVSPRDVVRYLVQNEPLVHVAEVSRSVDGYTSQLKQDSFAIDSLNTAIDTGERMAISIDELLIECQEFYSGVRKRMKEVENVVDTRSQDIRGAIAQLHSTPLTTPPVSSLGISGHSVPQMSAKVGEIGAAQTKVLDMLEGIRDRLKVTLGGLSGRESTELLLGVLMSQTYTPPPPSLGAVAPRRAGYPTPPLHPGTQLTIQPHDSLWERYHRGLQEFESGVDKIVRNGETIRDLALALEGVRAGVRDSHPTVGHPTLAEELLAWQTQNPGAGGTPSTNPRNWMLPWRSLAAWLGVWVEYPTGDSQLPFLVSTSLTVLFVLANIVRARYHIGNLDDGQTIAQTANSIRELLLGDRVNVSDELLHNLIPRG